MTAAEREADARLWNMSPAGVDELTEVLGIAFAGERQLYRRELEAALDAALAQRDARLAAVEGRLAAAEARFAATATLLDKLEVAERNLAEAAKGGLFYRGVYKGDEAYKAGDCCTFGGSLWITTVPIAAGGDPPGHGSSTWKLAVKRGRDAERAR